VAGRSSELACSAEVDPRLADRARLSWARENVLVGLGNQSLLSETGIVIHWKIVAIEFLRITTQSTTCRKYIIGNLLNIKNSFNKVCL
jgi:hypothetical protein